MSEVRREAESYGRWYHPIELEPGYTTASLPYQDIWGMIRDGIAPICYQGTSVIDIGTMDGLWAFEAEKRGAKCVVAADCYANPRLNFAHKTLKSKSVLIQDVDASCLRKHVNRVMEAHDIFAFDIVHFMGVLYHLKNPMKALSEIRHCISAKGVLLLESGCWLGCPNEPVMRMNRADVLYDDLGTYWLPNLKCLDEMLKLCAFALDRSTLRRLPQPHNRNTERVFAICRPV